MKKLMMALAFMSAFALSACITTQDIEAKIGQVQSYTRLACSFVPTVTTIAKIFANGTSVDTARSVADAICNAVTTAPLADGPGDRIPRVNGVVVKGQFVR